MEVSFILKRHMSDLFMLGTKDTARQSDKVCCEKFIYFVSGITLEV